jgi:hypothetical protein
MSTTVEKILAAKTEAGDDAFLWLQSDDGDCILYASEEESENDNGSNRLSRWAVTAAECDELAETGEVDDWN